MAAEWQVQFVLMSMARNPELHQLLEHDYYNLNAFLHLFAASLLRFITHDVFKSTNPYCPTLHFPLGKGCMYCIVTPHLISK